MELYLEVAFSSAAKFLPPHHPLTPYPLPPLSTELSLSYLHLFVQPSYHRILSQSAQQLMYQQYLAGFVATVSY
jgi:hypothetical protein